MRKMKKIMALIVTVVMCMSMMSISAFAEGEGKSITLSGGKAGHTYTLYQIFTGTVDGEELTNIQWGDGITAAFQATKETAAAYAAEIAEADDARATAQALVAASALTNGTDCVLSADGDVEFTGLAEGYYVIVDTNGNTGVVEGDYTSAYIVKVVEDVTGEIKGSGTTSDKQVLDASGEAAADDAAAYNIGDAVPFKLTATTADNVAAYKKYHITFHDTQSDGLDAPESYTVKVLGKEFTVAAAGTVTPANTTTTNGTKITVTKEAATGDETFVIKVEFEPTGTDVYINEECNSQDITVEYTAVLNDDAEIGLPGNDNTSNITYSNNPEDEDGGEEGKTPEDTVKVFTYKTVIDKVDADGNALENAGFTIYQEVAAGTTGAQLGSTIKTALAAADDSINADALTGNKYYVEKAMTLVSGQTAQFEFKGLADGTYVLVETTIPAGYNAFESVEFTVSSTVTDTGITTLTGTDPFTNTNPGEDGAVTVEGHDLDSGELYAEIENNSGQALPSTGGIGTTLFYVIGAVLVLGSGILLVTRRRMRAQ